MKVVYVKSKRQWRLLEWALIGPIALSSVGWVVWSSEKYPDPMPERVTVPMRNDVAVCPKDHPYVLEVDHSEGAVMCSSVGYGE